MVVPGKAMYIPGVPTSEGGINVDTAKYTVATVVVDNMVVVT